MFHEIFIVNQRWYYDHGYTL